METNKPDISSTDARNSILNHIINCANCALLNEEAFRNSMSALAKELRAIFDSEYCAIGIVTDEYAEDCVISYKKYDDEQLSKLQEASLNSVKRVSIKDDRNTVSLALKSDNNAWFKEEKMDGFDNYARYKTDILPSREVKNSYVIPLRDKTNHNYGFIQLINTNKTIDYNRDILPFKDAFLGLVQAIINIKKTKLELANRVKDANFYSTMQDKRDNVDELLDSIMEYFSYEFNAAVVSFRIPILNGYNKEPLFYLRRVFVHPSIVNRDELKHRYYSERQVKNKDEMRVVNELRCDNQDNIFESHSVADFSQYHLDLNENTLIMPIIHNTVKTCINPKRDGHNYCKKDEHHYCNERFKRYYGFFRLRISKTDLNNCNNNNYSLDYEDMRDRLSYLSKQITLLIDSIVNKNENESLDVFQDELKISSFIKIQDFDERCVEIIKKSVHAKVCSIYRYNDRTKLLTLSASTARNIHFSVSNTDTYIETERIKDSCFIHVSANNNVLIQALKTKNCIYVLNIKDEKVHKSSFLEFIKNENESAMAIPMIKKDGTCSGVVLLLGKEEHKHSISTAYWEHDINHIEFIVNTLTRMSESDRERLTFLSQLSHELLAPVTELVYDNDLIVNIAERNTESISKRQLVAKIKENINRNMLFKYIIADTEFIYSSTERSIEYNIVRQDHPQDILLDAIRLLEKEAHAAKGLTIKTYIKEMPPLYFDKERMMQVFLNLIQNAIKYADKHTQISISYYKRDDGFHELCFGNVGISISEGEKDSIFELFHRGKSAKIKVPRGTGMGLYIVRDIMRAHGGDCYVRRYNNPTEFAITLPNKEYSK